MKVALTESFLDDLTELPIGIKRKGLELLSALRQIEPRNLREQVLPGWRLHKLQSSPFISLSLDMNYRVLAKIEGETVFLYRAVKHSLADSPKVNRNDALETPYSITADEVKPSDIYAILGATGFLKEQIQIFKDVQTDDDLLDKLGELESTIADYVLAATCNDLCNTKTATRLVTLLMRKTATTWVTHSTLRITRSRNENKGCSAEGSRMFIFARHTHHRNCQAIEEVAALGVPMDRSL